MGASDAVCTTDVAAAAVGPSLPAHLTALAAVTRDHDLWINEDPRSGDLADLAYWADPRAGLDPAAADVTLVLVHGRGARAAGLADAHVRAGDTRICRW